MVTLHSGHNMVVLSIENTDLILDVKCNKFHSAFNKARVRQHNILTSTNYTTSETSSSNLKLRFLNSNSELTNIEEGIKYHPVFFENKDYFFGVRFKNKEIENPFVYCTLKDIKDKFFLEDSIHFLSGTINYGNDIGKTDFTIRYKLDGKFKELKLSYEVFPTKLDYRNDYDQLIADIEEEYPLLVLDYLRKTYHGFKTGNSQKTDLIWWQIFGKIYNDLIASSKFILNKPHSRLVKKTLYQKVDRIKRMTPRLEEEYHRFKSDHPNRYYRTDYRILSSNTPENQFFKFAIFQIQKNFIRVKNFINQKFSSKITTEFKEELNNIEKEFRVITNHPFFRTIDDFKGLRQESLVLNKATGYNSLFKSWNMLNSGIQFLEGILKLEIKNIAELYQIWCFLEVKKVIQNILGKEKPDDIELAQIEVDSFIFKIRKGVKSRVLYKLDDGQEVELFHDFSINQTNSNGMVAPTIKQKPDIVLRITKQDLLDNYKLTYLYDAKYRLVSDTKEKAPDIPPDDAINQMHRYRDAIYYNNPNSKQLEKEVIGGYILFPGKGDLEEIKDMPFYKSIGSVNIGAFPLCPSENSNKELLNNHLRKLLTNHTEHHIETILPHKDIPFKTINATVLIGIVPKKNNAQYQYFLNGDANIYHTGSRKPARFGFEKLKYFAPYLGGKGIFEYYEIENYSIKKRKDIYPKGHPQFKDDDSERLVLTLKKGKSINLKKTFFKLMSGTIQSYRYTNIFNIRNSINDLIDVFPAK